MVAAPYQLNGKVSWEKDGRNFGANPLGYKALLNEFGYEIIHCDTTGTMCFFVLQSLLPKTCPTSFPLPSFTYPVLRAIDSPNNRPLLVNSGLLEQLKMSDGFLSPVLERMNVKSLMFEDQMSSRGLLAMWRTNYRRFESEVEYSFMKTLGSCLQDHSCADVSNDLTSSLDLFAHHRELCIQRGILLQSSDVQWTCSTIEHALIFGNRSSVCYEIANLYLKQVLFLLDMQYTKDVWEGMLQEGLRYDSHNPGIKAIRRYINWHEYLTTTKAYLRYSFSFMFIGGIEKSAGFGVGICDNILHRVRNDRVFHPVSTTMTDRLFSLEHPFISHFIPEEQYTAQRHTEGLSDAVPYYSREDTVLSLIPPGFRDSVVVMEGRDRLEDMCALRSSLKTFLVLGPEMSGTENIRFLVDGVQSTSSLSHLNLEILRDVGCFIHNSHEMSNDICQQALYDLSHGFLVDLPDKGNKYWNNFTEMIYQQRLLQLSQETVVLADPLFSFTAPLWQGPLGNVEVVLVLTDPTQAVYCLSRSLHLTLHDATSRWLFYFKSVLSSSLSFDKIHLMEYVHGLSTRDFRRSLQRHDVFSKIFSDDTGHVVDVAESKSICDFSDYAPGEVILPSWVTSCYEAIINEKIISPELCLAYV